MVPEAPPRFSTTTGWASIGLILSANSRATASTPPPGGKLTTRRMLREGKLSWASAGTLAPSAALPSRPNLTASRRFMIVDCFAGVSSHASRCGSTVLSALSMLLGIGGIFGCGLGAWAHRTAIASAMMLAVKPRRHEPVAAPCRAPPGVIAQSTRCGDFVAPGGVVREHLLDCRIQHLGELLGPRRLRVARGCGLQIEDVLGLRGRRWHTVQPRVVGAVLQLNRDVEEDLSIAETSRGILTRRQEQPLITRCHPRFEDLDPALLPRSPGCRRGHAVL